MYSEYDYLYNPPTISIGGYFNVINVIIIIILIVCFYILINNFSISHFSNIPSKQNELDNDIINEIKSELQTIRSELSYIKPETSTTSDVIYVNNQIIPSQNKILPDTNIISPDTNIISPDTNIILPPSPPIIYDPIEAYDRKKLLDPLIDPRGRSSADQIPTPQIAAQLNFPTQGILDRYHRVGLLVAINNDNVHNDRNRNNFRRNQKDREDCEDFGNIEKIDKSGKVKNIDTDSSSTSNNNKYNRYKDNSSDISTIDDSSYNNSYNDNDYKKKIIPNNVVLEITDRDNDILELIGKKIANEWYRYFTSISKGNKIIKINVHNRNRKELYDGDIVYLPILKRYYRVKIDKLDMIEYNPYFF